MENIKPLAIYMCLGLLAIHTWIILFRCYLPLKKLQPFISANLNGVSDVREKKILQKPFVNERLLPSTTGLNFSGLLLTTSSNITSENSPLKIILMWNAWATKMADAPLVKGQCPVKSCVFTTDMSLIEQSDIVVLHFDTLDDYPMNRQPHQRFVFYHFESPENTASTLLNDPRFRYNYFNWTMTYRRDSDIFLRDFYGSVISKKSLENNTREVRYQYNINAKGNKFVFNATELVNDIPGIKLGKTQWDLINLIKQKTKMVTWFVGHCDTKIRREEYVRQLSQYVSVDVFGHCTKSCPYQCDEMLRKEYKFYLAFENSWCPDYVTEKFIRPYLYNAVPIVLGNADYSQFAPTYSYINARHFGSPKELAEYLIILNNSDALYARYFHWKTDYYISVPDMHGWCELCRMSHDKNLPIKVYHDIKKWWMMEAGECESNSTEFFRAFL